MAADRVAADLGAVTRSALDIEPTAGQQRAQRGQAQALLHHVESGPPWPGQRSDGQAHTVAGHARADLETLVETGGERQLEAAQTG